MNVIIAACAALALSACGTVGKLTPEMAHQLITDFHNAGCGGDVSLDAGAASGQLGGEAHLTLGLHGQCPVGDVPPQVVPLSQIDKLLTPGATSPN